MNWSRGLLRLWMIFTVLWVSGVGWAAYNEMRSTVVRKADGTVERWVKVNDAITLEHFHALQEGRKPDADLLEALNSWPYYLYKRREFDFFAWALGVPAGFFVSGLTLLWIGRGFRR